jgi:hypothetical protein
MVFCNDSLTRLIKSIYSVVEFISLYSVTLFFNSDFCILFAAIDFFQLRSSLEALSLCRSLCTSHLQCDTLNYFLYLKFRSIYDSVLIFGSTFNLYFSQKQNHLPSREENFVFIYNLFFFSVCHGIPSLSVLFFSV